MQTPDHPKAVYRQLAIPVDAFDHIKDMQRAHEASSGQRLTLNAIVARIVAEHRHLKNVEREGQTHAQVPRPVASLLR